MVGMRSENIKVEWAWFKSGSRPAHLYLCDLHCDQCSHMFCISLVRIHHMHMYIVHIVCIYIVTYTPSSHMIDMQTLYSVQCTLYSVHCTLYSVHYTLYTVQCSDYCAVLNHCFHQFRLTTSSQQELDPHYQHLPSNSTSPTTNTYLNSSTSPTTNTYLVVQPAPLTTPT